MSNPQREFWPWGAALLICGFFLLVGFAAVVDVALSEYQRGELGSAVRTVSLGVVAIAAILRGGWPVLKPFLARRP